MKKKIFELFNDATSNISKLSEYQRTGSEVVKNMVIKKYVFDKSISIRNKNTPNEIKALI
jgi:hypothetical protein